jgi:hypothetical protein
MLPHHQGRNLELFLKFKLLNERKTRSKRVQQKWVVEMARSSEE